MSTKQKPKPVLILDTHRGIVFGYLKKTMNGGKTVELERARHCFYYAIAETGHRGTYGLATVGPADGSKIGPEVSIIVNDVSKIIDCTKEAVDRWQKIIW